MQIEIWKKVREFENMEYYVSNLWNIKNNKTWKILKIQDNGNWYKIITIWHSIKRKIHRMVAEEFIWSVKWKVVCHIDDNPANNNVSNLFIWTTKDNIQDMVNKWRQRKWLKIINQFTLDWVFIRSWNWAWEIKRKLWFSDSTIYSCCKWIYKQSMWFIWKYS